MTDPLAITYGTPYPYAPGYAQISDVSSRINAGDWDPTDPTAFPTAAMVNTWLEDATAAIDSSLAKRGYYVPLTPQAGWPVAGTPAAKQPLYQGIGIQAWLILRNAAAAYAASYVEKSRHGAVGTGNQDPDAAAWMTTFTDTLERIENGTYNLTAYGVDGAFTPMIDPAQALQSGSIGFITASHGTRREGPFFWRDQDLGSGWERTTPTVPSFNVASNDAREPFPD